MSERPQLSHLYEMLLDVLESSDIFEPQHGHKISDVFFCSEDAITTYGLFLLQAQIYGLRHLGSGDFQKKKGHASTKSSVNSLRDLFCYFSL